MGQTVIIRLVATDDKSIKEVNKLLKKQGIKRTFNTEADNIAWFEDINKNPKSPQAHLKPITLDQLKGLFKLYCEPGVLFFDVAFSRTTQAEAKRYAKFILQHAQRIKELEGADSMIERFELSMHEQEIIKKLNKVVPEPVKLPIEERTKKDLQGGHMLCKSWGLQPFWVIFGNVDTPKFMKDKQYEDDMYNNLYKDKKGLAYLLIPLLPMNDKQLEFVEKVYDEAWSMGLRENFNFFIPFVYGLDIANYSSVAEQYKKSYTVEELKERFFAVMTATSNTFPYNGPNGFMWNDIKTMFVPCGTNTPSTLIQSKCSILTCLLRALGPEIAAEIMSTFTGKKYFRFEFTK